MCVWGGVAHKTGREKLRFKRGWEILLFVLEFCVWPVAGGNCKHGCHGDGWRGSKNISCDLSLRCCVTRSSSKCVSCQIEKAENFTAWTVSDCQVDLLLQVESRLSPPLTWWTAPKNLRSAGFEGAGGYVLTLVIEAANHFRFEPCHCFLCARVFTCMQHALLSKGFLNRKKEVTWVSAGH